jgi:hypothetical protein
MFVECRNSGFGPPSRQAALRKKRHLGRGFFVLAGTAVIRLARRRKRVDVALNADQSKRVTARSLRKLAPGRHLDDRGAEYFYLTGLYPSVAHRLLKTPPLNNPACITDILCELRCELEFRYCKELMD